ncbi:MAG TPA: hypothetical protein VKU85_15575, partial [bacterium]|nr:hypothetical protein [bacterium]
ESHHRRNANHDRRILYPTATFLGTKPRFRVGADGRPRLERPPVRLEDYRSSRLLDLIRVAQAARRAPPSATTVRLTESLIREMAGVARENDAAFLLVNWRWRDGAAAPFGDLGVPVLDTLDDAPPDWAHWTLPQDDHPGPRACARVARMIRDALAPAVSAPETP